MAEPGGNHWQAAKAVFWSFFGVRKKTHYEQDAMQLSPAQVIVIGLISAVLFVLTLVGIVWLVTN
jgi:preprotein translocase subunit Sec61beta